MCIRSKICAWLHVDRKNPPPPGWFSIYYVPWSRAVCKRFHDEMRPSHLVVKSLTHGSWSGSIVNWKPPGGGGFLSINLIDQRFAKIKCIRSKICTWFHEWVMSHMNESCHTHEWVMSHTWMKCNLDCTWSIKDLHLICSQKSSANLSSHQKFALDFMNESCHTHEWVMSHTWMSHVTHMNESCHTHEWVLIIISSKICTWRFNWIYTEGSECSNLKRYKFYIERQMQIFDQRFAPDFWLHLICTWLNLYRGIWVFQSGEFFGGRILSGNCQIFTCMYVCINIHIHTYMYMYKYIYIYMYKYTYTYIYVYV